MKIVIRGIVLAWLLIVTATITMAPPSEPFDLQDYRWERRVLIVFADDDGDEPYRALKRTVEDQWEAFEDRDMLVVEVLASGSSRAGG